MSNRRLLLVHYTPPGVIGGAEHIIQQHIDLFRGQGLEVETVAGRPSPNGTPVRVIPEMDVTSDDNQRLEDELRSGAVSPLYYRLLQAIRSQLIPLAARADAVIVHNAFTLHFSLPLTSALWEIAGERSYGTVIAWCHDLAWTNPLYIPSMHAGYPWDLLRLRAPDVHYVTVSHERKRELIALWGGGQEAAVTVIPNGIDVERFLRLSDDTRAIVDRYKLFDRDLVLILPVRITRRKNIELAIHAVKALKERGLDVCFLVSGPVAPHHPSRSHSYLGTLKQLRGDLAVEDEVVFLADELDRNLDDRVVSELYTVADALLFPSAQEGFGLPILEAGLAHIPAIVSDIPIFNEVGGGEIATFGLKDSGKQIADVVLQSVNAPSSQLFRHVIRHYRWHSIMKNNILPLLSQVPGGASDDG